jgi:hypothetical protein
MLKFWKKIKIKIIIIIIVVPEKNNNIVLVSKTGDLWGGEYSGIILSFKKHGSVWN